MSNYPSLSPLSEATQRYIAQHLTDNVAQLALRGTKDTNIDLTAALTHIEALQRLRTKVPTWTITKGLRFPLRLALEQCSGEIIAKHKAALIASLLPTKGIRMADITGGMGVDFWAITTAVDVAEAHYIERLPQLCAAAAHNFPLLGLQHTTVHCNESEDWLAAQPKDSLDLIYLDPARRDGHGRKTILLEDCTPNLTTLLPNLLDKAKLVVAKLSPMLDIHATIARFSGVQDVHIYSHQGECKEVVLIIGREAVEEPRLHCHAMDYTTHLTFLPSKEHAVRITIATTLRAYLYEPDVAVMKAGAFASVATACGSDLEKLHPNSHLYTSDTLHKHFAGRCFRIVADTPINKKAVRTTYATHIDLDSKPKANLTVRNFPTTVTQLRKQLQLSEGGVLYLFATTLHDGTHRLLWCKKVG
ncbi:MAG: SAM-dependent methyltransferase [Bacteroidales bacterium]|nr:SAM-dependent methyltransferase [Bacteroidales bacterium]